MKGMADFKQVVELLEDNDKTAMYMNNVQGFSKKKGRDELTVAVENGWGQKVITGSAVCVVLVVDRDEWSRICNVIDSKDIAPTESTQAKPEAEPGVGGTHD